MSILRVALRSSIIVSAFTAGAFAVAACQGAGQPRDAAAGFLASNDYGLHYVDAGETVKLAYGQANSEVMSLMLECSKGSGTVEISDVARGAGKLSLKAGGRRSEFAGEVEPAPMSSIILARAQSSVPALQGFRETGRVQVVNGPLAYDVAATSQERPSVERFFAACDRTV